MKHNKAYLSDVLSRRYPELDDLTYKEMLLVILARLDKLEEKQRDTKAKWRGDY